VAASGRATLPVDFDVGKEDRGNVFDRASVLRECDPELDLRIVDHCKHLVQWDASDDFHELAARFLPN
jgi:pimeloyl-ACP methyl ester carboxylesterase